MNDDYIEDLSLTQKVSILLLGANNFQPVKGKKWFQKELFLISQNIEELKEEADFESDFIGPYSEMADEELDQLRREGIINKGIIKLTSYGQDIHQKLQHEFSPIIMQIISDMKNFLNDLTEDELLGFIYYSYPQMKIDSIEFTRIEKIRKPIAISLFRKGKVSLGVAAIIAGLSREELIQELGMMGVRVFAE